MMKRKLFIGSSKEGLFYANQVKDIITQECGDWLECEVWNEGGIFTLNKSTLENLVKASRRFDYGVLVATNDDLALIRLKVRTIPRDNVIFEMGLFLGSLGLTRAFLLTQEKCKLPSDYNGITTVRLPQKKSISINIKLLINQLNETKDTYSLKAIPSTALGVGYFDNFVLPFCKNINKKGSKLNILIPKHIDDIRSLITSYESDHPSVDVNVFGDGQRPVAKQLVSDNLSYWDIPTTLSTLFKMINLVNPNEEIGLSPEKKDWIEYELRNFKGTLEVLLNQNSICKGKVLVSWV
jgi:hypothetical protein